MNRIDVIVAIGEAFQISMVGTSLIAVVTIVYFWLREFRWNWDTSDSPKYAIPIIFFISSVASLLIYCVLSIMGLYLIS